jgi:insertion element IS1 protein InsB
VNQALLASVHPDQIEVEVCRADELEVRRGLSTELDEMWSYVTKKANPRWLWPAIDHRTGKVLASVVGRRQDQVFLKLKALLEPFGITRDDTDGWGTYERHVDAEQHTIGKAHMQRIESKHINLRTRIKRLVRRTIWSSACSSTGVSSGEPSDMRSTTLKHPPEIFRPQDVFQDEASFGESDP